MTEAIASIRLDNGLLLNRRYDPGAGSCDDQCGTLASWADRVNQIQQPLAYYAHKFTEKVEANIYSLALPFPNGQIAKALTYPLGNSRSKIDLQYMDPAGSAWNGRVYVPNTYRLPAAFSHEMGHACCNWVGLYGDTYASALQEIARAWEKMVSLNRTPYAEGVAPWNLDKPYEQFANMVRCLIGTNVAPGNTRGSSNNDYDPVVPGFENPGAHADWLTMLQYMPELAGFILKYGAKTDSLQWWGGFCWFFTTAIAQPDCPAGTQVYQDGYYSWWKSVNGTWQRFYPTYTRF